MGHRAITGFAMHRRCSSTSWKVKPNSGICSRVCETLRSPCLLSPAVLTAEESAYPLSLWLARIVAFSAAPNDRDDLRLLPFGDTDRRVETREFLANRTLLREFLRLVGQGDERAGLQPVGEVKAKLARSGLQASAVQIGVEGPGGFRLKAGAATPGSAHVRMALPVPANELTIATRDEPVAPANRLRTPAHNRRVEIARKRRDQVEIRGEDHRRVEDVRRARALTERQAPAGVGRLERNVVKPSRWRARLEPGGVRVDRFDEPRG